MVEPFAGDDGVVEFCAKFYKKSLSFNGMERAIPIGSHKLPRKFCEEERKPVVHIILPLLLIVNFLTPPAT